MSTARFEIRASRATLHAPQASITDGLRHSWGAHVMRWTWKGGTCQAWAPGAEGSLFIENGHVVATVSLSMFALPFKTQIYHDIDTVLKRLGEGQVMKVEPHSGLSAVAQALRGI